MSKQEVIQSAQELAESVAEFVLQMMQTLVKADVQPQKSKHDGECLESPKAKIGDPLHLLLRQPHLRKLLREL